VRARPHVPRTGRRKKLRVKKTAKRKMLGQRNPKVVAQTAMRRAKPKRRRK
jgi:hypothetical protein